MISIDNTVLLTKNSIYESINLSIFVITGISLALLASSHTNLYNDDNVKNSIKVISVTLLFLAIIYAFYNVQDYKDFITNFKTKEDNNVLSIYTEYNFYIMYGILILLSSVLICNIIIMM
jgi:hypothetical protein